MARHIPTILVILCCIGLLLATIPFVQKTREAAARTQAINNAKQLSLSLHSFQDVYRRLPAAFDESGLMKFPASMHVHLVPFIQSGPFYKQYVNAKGVGMQDVVISPFLDPLDYTCQKDNGVQNFAGNLRVFSAKGLQTKYDAELPELADVEPGQTTFKDISDGLENTIVFATKLAICGEGGSRYAATVNSPFAAFFGQNPATIPAHAFHPGVTFQLAAESKHCRWTPLTAQSPSLSGLIIGTGDGNAKVLHVDIAPNTWNKLLQPNDGLTLPTDW